jgi:hypothetical protein
MTSLAGQKRCCKCLQMGEFSPRGKVCKACKDTSKAATALRNKAYRKKYVKEYYHKINAKIHAWKEGRL